MKNVEFCLLLTANHYTNPNSFHFHYPIKLNKSTNCNSNIDNDLITANNFFAHWVKETNEKRYSEDVQIFPTSSPYEICQYFDAKYLLEKFLKIIQKLLLYSNKR